MKKTTRISIFFCFLYQTTKRIFIFCMYEYIYTRVFLYPATALIVRDPNLYASDPSPSPRPLLPGHFGCPNPNPNPNPFPWSYQPEPRANSSRTSNPSFALPRITSISFLRRHNKAANRAGPMHIQPVLDATRMESMVAGHLP